MSKTIKKFKKKFTKQISKKISNFIFKDENENNENYIDEEYIFFHNDNKLIKLEIPEKDSFKNSNISSKDGILFKENETNIDFKELEKIKLDNNLNDLRKKIVKYLKYEDEGFNCEFMNNISLYAKDIGYDNTNGYLIPLIKELTSEKDMNIKIIGYFFKGFEKFLEFIYLWDSDHSMIINNILPVIEDLINNKNDKDIISGAVYCLKLIIKHLTQKECDNEIIPFLIEIANNEQNTIVQKVSMNIFNDNAKFFSKEIIVNFIIPQYESLAGSSDDTIRTYCIKNMKNIYEIVPYDILQTKLIPIYKKFTRDIKKNIRKISCDIMPNICKILDKNLISKELLPIYLNLINDYENEIRTSAFVFFGEFISYLNKEDIIAHDELFTFFELYTLDVLSGKVSNINEKIIKNYIKSIENIFRNVPYEIFENKLVCIFEKFSKDSNKLVKIMCCDILPNICKIADKKLISTKILPIYLNLIKDSENEVKTSAIIAFGDFIPYLEKNDIINNNELLSFYKNHISYILNNNDDLKITLAQSFGKISAIFDIKTNETVLASLIISMYKSKGNEIKKTITEIIPEFLTNISDEKIKNDFLAIFRNEFVNIKLTKKWRDKIIYIKGIKTLSKLYDNDTIFQSLLKLVFQLCFDNFSKVKIKAAKTLSFIASKILSANENENKVKILEIIKMFATCVNYKYRQLFVYICNYLIYNENIFMKFIFNDLQNLSYDNCSNVRVTLSKFFSEKWNKGKEEIKWIKSNDKILQLIYDLKNDNDNDVKDYLKSIEIDKINVINVEERETKDINKKFKCKFEGAKNIFYFIPPL